MLPVEKDPCVDDYDETIERKNPHWEQRETKWLFGGQTHSPEKKKKKNTLTSDSAAGRSDWS